MIKQLTYEDLAEGSSIFCHLEVFGIIVVRRKLWRTVTFVDVVVGIATGVRLINGGTSLFKKGLESELNG